LLLLLLLLLLECDESLDSFNLLLAADYEICLLIVTVYLHVKERHLAVGAAASCLFYQEGDGGTFVEDAKLLFLQLGSDGAVDTFTFD